MSVDAQTHTWTLVMEMLALLHRQGYQRLRLSAGAAPSGLHWRYGVAPVEQFEANGYLLRSDYYPGVAYGSSSGGHPPFEWDGVEGVDVDALVSRFLRGFPELAEAGRGSDPEYARWFAQAVELCRPDCAPVMYGEYVDAEAAGRFNITNGETVGLPPPRNG